MKRETWIAINIGPQFRYLKAEYAYLEINKDTFDYITVHVMPSVQITDEYYWICDDLLSVYLSICLPTYLPDHLYSCIGTN